MKTIKKSKEIGSEKMQGDKEAIRTAKATQNRKKGKVGTQICNPRLFGNIVVHKKLGETLANKKNQYQEVKEHFQSKF